MGFVEDDRSPLAEATHLREVAEKIIKREEQRDPENTTIGLVLNSVVRALMMQAEADALERGYYRGRAMAAYDVRMGLDEMDGNGSVHYDSDTAPPPEWIVRKAEKLARGWY